MGEAESLGQCYGQGWADWYQAERLVCLKHRVAAGIKDITLEGWRELN